MLYYNGILFVFVDSFKIVIYFPRQPYSPRVRKKESITHHVTIDKVFNLLDYLFFLIGDVYDEFDQKVEITDVSPPEQPKIQTLYSYLNCLVTC